VGREEMTWREKNTQLGETIMNGPIALENQLLVTKFSMPVAPGSLISRPRLITLLNESWKYPLTLVSAAAGFGKTTLLVSWAQSLQARDPRVAWVSLEEEDNDPQSFWTYVLTALKRQKPERFTSLVTLLQSPPSPPLNHLLAALINVLVEERDDFLLILDDYQVITEQQVHTALSGHPAGSISAGDEGTYTNRRVSSGLSVAGAIERARTRGPAAVGEWGIQPGNCPRTGHCG
jgi:AAA domain